MDRHAGHRDAVGERVADGVRAGEGRQERGVRVDDPAAEGLEHARADQSHVAGQHDDIGCRAGQRVGQGRIVAVGDESRVDPLLRRPREARACAIGEDEHHCPPEQSALGCPNERAEVRPGARHADRDPPRHPSEPST
jgi:hypothetical protein